MPQAAGRKGVAKAEVKRPVELLLPEGGVDIDGSQLEGGGQILRLSASLAAITGTPVRVTRIRANRARPGLQPQHLTGLQLAAALCGGELEGGAVGSAAVTLVPGRLQPGQHAADTRTAGSCTLLAQVALPPLLFAGQDGGSLQLRGGTDADMAPPAGYLTHVLLPTLRQRFQLELQAKLVCRGFYPRGGGLLELSARGLPPGAALPPLQLTQRGAVESVAVHAFAAGRLDASVAHRMAAAARRLLRKVPLGTAARLPLPFVIGSGGSRMRPQGLEQRVPVSEHVSHCGPDSDPAATGEGAGILLTAATAGGCLLGAAVPGRRGVPAEEIGAQAAHELLEDLEAGGCVDRWLQDQLVVFLALAAGESRLACGEPSLHTRSAMLVAEKLTGARFRVEPPAAEGACWHIVCQGAGVAA